MFPLNYSLAIVILTSPINNNDLFYLAPIIQNYCGDIQITDVRNNYLYLNNRSNFASDIKLIRETYLEIYDAPRIEDSYSFPDKETIIDNMKFNRLFKTYLENRMAIDILNESCYLELIQETDNLHSIYNNAVEIQIEYYNVYPRRIWLLELRNKIGYTNFYLGRLPPVVPLDCFIEIK